MQTQHGSVRFDLWQICLIPGIAKKNLFLSTDRQAAALNR
ncbi:hypothetical protein DLM_1163 [Aquitalea magnusonii]|uniref:Uncharacterized protein n=1 Tax=Aquitalea magnusonii TaxID=332411 RepID=A0A3G9GA49_9NEIS|nr:hypothetical protein DLM_1163 [Aquitalea magnusonii]